MRMPSAVRESPASGSSELLYRWLLLALFVEYARPASFAPFLAVPFLYSAIPILLAVVQIRAAGARALREILSDPVSKWILVFYLLIPLSAVHADVTEYVYKVTRGTFGYVLLFFLIVRIATSLERIRGIALTLLVAHLFLLAMNPAVMTSGDRSYISGATFLGDGNDFAMSICLLFPLVVEAAGGLSTKWKRIMLWSCAAVLVMAVIATQSRGGTLGIAAALAFLWVYSPRKIAVLIGVAICALIVALYAPPAYFQRVGAVSGYAQEDSAKARIEAWKAASRMAIDHPLTGVGAGHFPTSYGTTYRAPSNEGLPWANAHSVYFMALGELGLPGLLCVLMMTVGNAFATLRVRGAVLSARDTEYEQPRASMARMLLYCAAAAVGFSVAGAFLSATYYPHMFVLSGLLVSARNIATNLVASSSVQRPNSQRRASSSPGRGSSKLSTS